MAYCFPPLNGKGNPRQYEKPIASLTQYDKGDPSKEFCKDLKRYNIKAFDFDSVKDDWCDSRNALAAPGKKQKSRSVDAFVNHNGSYYFIEFKFSRAEKLDDIDDDGDSIDSQLRKKAIDSIALSGMTALQDIPGRTIMDHAEFIVVYHRSFDDNEEALAREVDAQPGIRKISGTLHMLADAKDSLQPKLDVKWKLARLKKEGFFRDVHTWNEDYFVDWAKKNLI